jgi:hypothetical protein
MATARPITFTDQFLSTGAPNPAYDAADPRLSAAVLHTIQDNLAAAIDAGDAAAMAAVATKADATHGHPDLQPRIEIVSALANTGTAFTIADPTTGGTIVRRTLNGSPVVITFPTATAGKSFLLELVQDATGSRLVTWPAAVRWPGGTAPTLTAAAGRRDVLTFVCTDGSTWLGFVGGLNFT